MKIVIDIDENVFTRLFDNGTENYEIINDLIAIVRAVRKGSLLPQGHGRLIDADKLMELCLNSTSCTIDCNDIARFPTVIGTDK